MSCCGGQSSVPTVTTSTASCGESSFISQPSSQLIAPVSPSMECSCPNVPRFPCGVSQVISASNVVVFNY